MRVLPIATIAAVGCDAAFGQILTPVAQPPLVPAYIYQSIGDLVPYPPGPTFYDSSGAGALINDSGDTVTTAFYEGGKGLATVSISGGTVPRDAGVQEIYYFEVFGPPGALVPVIEFFSGEVSVDNLQNSYAQASFSTGYNPGVLLTPTVTISAGNPTCSGYSACFPDSNAVPVNSFGNQVIPEYVSINTPYYITLNAYGVSQGVGKVNVTVDPNVTFAPGFDSTGYTLEFSPDAVAAVPEPRSSWLLLAGCFGLLAARRLRSRQS